MMPRPKGKARRIAYNILGKPVNIRHGSPTKKKNRDKALKKDELIKPKKSRG